MLLNDLYTIEDIEVGAEMVRATVFLETQHPVVTGHSPGQPVLPGACQLQLVRELLSHATGKNCRLERGEQIKFLTMVDPRQHPRLELQMKYSREAEDRLRVAAVVYAGGDVCLKLSGIFP